MEIVTDVAEQLERATGEVAASGVENRVVIGKWDILEPMLGDIPVKRRPAAVAALEGEQPVQRALEHLLSTARFLIAPGADHPQADEHHRGVVGIGIKNVIELERPPAGRPGAGSSSTNRRASRTSFVSTSRSRLSEAARSSGRARTRRASRDMNRGIPNGREAGLDAEILRIIDEEPFEVPDRLLEKRIVIRITEGAHCDDRVEHRGENGGQTV